MCPSYLPGERFPLLSPVPVPFSLPPVFSVPVPGPLPETNKHMKGFQRTIVKEYITVFFHLKEYKQRNDKH